MTVAHSMQQHHAVISVRLLTKRMTVAHNMRSHAVISVNHCTKQNVGKEGPQCTQVSQMRVIFMVEPARSRAGTTRRAEWSAHTKTPWGNANVHT
jgi:hypothetical protein